ncbi:hypothetical protein ASE23_12965 [Rhizobium sp. Root73]|nr:hypothetical protein ASD36_15165 [Rhizobium sp. Root1334]KRC00342.1 hypothetical protein ASE23_12965 [Rhizobium sp. Root73]
MLHLRVQGGTAKKSGMRAEARMLFCPVGEPAMTEPNVNGLMGRSPNGDIRFLTWPAIGIGTGNISSASGGFDPSGGSNREQAERRMHITTFEALRPRA